MMLVPHEGRASPPKLILLALLILASICICSSSSGGGAAERSFVALKPETLERGLVGDVISRFERKGLRLVGMKLVKPSEELVRSHYAEHIAQPWFPLMLKRFCEACLVAMVWEGEDCVKKTRKMVGCTDPSMAEPGSIRGELGTSTSKNLVHASDSTESATREISLWFQEEELISW